MIAAALLACGTAAYGQSTSSDAVVGPGGSSTSSTTTPANPPKIVAPTATTSVQASGWLSDQETRRSGQVVDHLTFRVTNKTKSPVKYDFPNGQQFDVVVTDSNAKEVWTWSKNRVFTQLVTHLTLKPGESRSFSIDWSRRDDANKPVAPGTYTATASLQTLARIVVSATSTVNGGHLQRDPTNVGLPSPPGQTRATDIAQTGTVTQSDIAPSVTAKTTIIVRAPGSS